MWGIFKKKSKAKEVLQIEQFNIELNKVLVKDDYISVKEYSYLFDKYLETKKSIQTIIDAGLVRQFCRKNKVDIEFLEKFLNDYQQLNEIINAHNENFIQQSMIELNSYLDNILVEVDEKIKLDDDQRKVVLSDEDYSLVIAGAGAGKTTTIAGKVKYLVDKKHIEPSEILIISFTNKAVNELKDRINKALKIPCPITTFHSAGNAILHKKEDEKLQIVEESFLYNTIQNYFREKIKDTTLAQNLILFFASYFDVEYAGDDKKTYFNKIFKTDFSTLKSNLNEYNYTYFNYASKTKVTLNSEIVKSLQEVQIANFLYLNGISYEYEASYPYHIYLSRKPYTPDFLIEQNGRKIYIEHFGIAEDGTNSRYTQEELAKYKKCIEDKISIHNKHNTELICTFAKYNDGRSLLEHLNDELVRKGVELNPIPYSVVLEKLSTIEENKYISKMVVLLTNFIKNFKTNGYTEEKFYEFIRTCKSERTKIFLEICKECYLEYQRALARNNAIDFQDMINDAARALREVEELKEKLNFKYIIIDEYQDISRQRFDMAKELSKVTDAKIIAVGDDWQSIFAFSGSDVTLFTHFREIMGYGKELKITRTYRNAQELIDIAGGFIQKNEAQIKKSLISPKHIEEPVVVVSYDDYPKRYDENAYHGGPLRKMAMALEDIIGEIVKQYGPKNKILLIGRFGYDGQRLSDTGLFEYNSWGSKITSKKYPTVEITFLTAHSSKGLGYDNVIIINAKDAVYGFPCKIEDDPVLNYVIKKSDEIEYAEERRLFYVALTRTKNKVYIIAPEKHPSEFVLELKSNYPNVTLQGELNPESTGLISNKVCPICGYPLQRRHNKKLNIGVWVCTNESEICGFVTNNLSGGKMYIQKCPECTDGYLIVKSKNDDTFLGCTNYKRDGSGCNKTVSQNEFAQMLLKNGTLVVEDIKDEKQVSSDVFAGDNGTLQDENIEVGENDTIEYVEKECACELDDIISESICQEEKSAIQDDDEIDKDDKHCPDYFADNYKNNLALLLRKYAEAMAIKEGIPYWKILRRKAVISLCEHLPLTKETLREKYILLGKEKIEKYGNDIIQIINDYVENNSKRTNLNTNDTSKNIDKVETQKINKGIVNAMELCKIIISANQEIRSIREFGAKVLANVLRGSKEQTILNYKLDKLNCYGCLHYIKLQTILDVIDILINEGFLYRSIGLYPMLRVNQNQQIENINETTLEHIQYLINDCCVNLNTQKDKREKIVNNNRAEVNGYNVYIDNDGCVITDLNLLKALSQARIELAKEVALPLYYVATNNMLVDLSTFKPTTKDEFIKIKGVGNKWYEKYGKVFTDHIIKCKNN